MITGMTMQTCFSIVHARSAAFLARQAAKLEQQQATGHDRERTTQILACACGSLFSSIAFLEALANELFADAARSDGTGPPASRFPANAAD